MGSFWLFRLLRLVGSTDAAGPRLEQRGPSETWCACATLLHTVACQLAAGGVVAHCIGFVFACVRVSSVLRSSVLMSVCLSVCPLCAYVLSQISGPEAFELWDTFGFPVDLTELMAEERGLKVDKKGEF